MVSQFKKQFILTYSVYELQTIPLLMPTVFL